MMRIPFFGLLAPKTHWEKLLAHYDKIIEGMKLIEDALECYIHQGGECPGFQDLSEQVNLVEAEADKIKRNIRNHLPRGLFMAVDRVLFFNYTRSQDNILDDGQEALNWLVMRTIEIPENLQARLSELLAEVQQTVAYLKPALDSTIKLLQGDHYDRQATKDTCRVVRGQHELVVKLQAAVINEIYNSDMDFKDIFQLVRFCEKLHGMSHNAEGCVDLLRAMIAR